MKLSLMSAFTMLFLVATVCGQSVRSLVNGGNDLYKTERYADAELKYRKALEKDSSLIPGKINLGNSLYKQGKVDEAVREYGSALEPVGPPDRRAQSFYDIGNSYLQQKKYQEAIQSYIESLKLQPDDFDSKYNLSYALQMLKQQQQQQKQNKDKKNQQNQDKKDKQDQNQQQKQDQQKNQQQQRQQQPQEKQMSKADAQRILDVLKNSERDVQKKLRTRQAVRPRTEKDW
jgi:Ca-activated chloride channel homolog